MSEQIPDSSEPLDHKSPETRDVTPPDPAGAKLFVIFFLAIVPLLGFALMAMVIYALLTG